MSGTPARKITFLQALFPVGGLISILVYGLIIRPKVLELDPFPLEIVFMSAAVLAMVQLSFLGFTWDHIQKAVIDKLSKAFPTILILFAIGMIIGSWIVAGTIPMMVYYGIRLIHTDYLYLISFLVAAIFSTFTGTSWGSVGTIGIVLIGVATTVHADLAITAGAIIGGAFFGDKMSPLSDTTNVAALAAEVSLYDHIHSMMYTTVPSALMACVAYFALGFIYPIEATQGTINETLVILNGIESMFNFSVLLLIPPFIVLFGSIKRMPALPTLVISSFTACFLAIFLQDITLTNVVQSLYTGFDTSMATWMTSVP